MAQAQTFPYARCETADLRNPVKVTNDVFSPAPSTYCFTIVRDNNCNPAYG